MKPQAERNTKIQARVAAGERQIRLAEEYGISRARINQICNPMKVTARRSAQWAVARGALTRQVCCSRCGQSGEIDMHHPDYTQPVEIEWLCTGCHTAEHTGQPHWRLLREPRTCLHCGRPYMRLPSSKAKYCSTTCASRAHRVFVVDRDARFQEMAAKLRAHVNAVGYIPGVCEFWKHGAGALMGTSVVTLVMFLDPGLKECGSYIAVADRLYRTAGFERPRGWAARRAPLGDNGHTKSPRSRPSAYFGLGQKT